MNEPQDATPIAQMSEWFLRPYRYVRVLAGFHSAAEALAWYPTTIWGDIAPKVSNLAGAHVHLPLEPNAGQAKTSSLTEPEALRMLAPFSSSLHLSPNVPISFAWVDLRNLIALQSVAYVLQEEDIPATASLEELANFSLVGPNALMALQPDRLISSSHLDIASGTMDIEDDQLVIRYRLRQPIRPVVVGYEKGRYFLITEYSRVLKAMESGIERILCIVYYGLNLEKRDLGIRLPWIQRKIVNHFGQERSLSNRPPLLRDFLDQSVTVTVPAKPNLFIIQPKMYSSELNFEIAPQINIDQ